MQPEGLQVSVIPAENFHLIARGIIHALAALQAAYHFIDPTQGVALG